MKKIVSLCLTLAMVFSSFATVKINNVKADEVYNFAADAVVTTSSNESAAYAGNLATDGDMNTRWSSSFADNQWIQLDFGKTVKIGSIQIFWEAAYAKKYKIAWSADGNTWNEAVEWSTSQYSSETSHMFYNRPVRYIRLTCLQRGTSYGVSIFEIKALGNKEVETTEAPTTEAATEATTVAPTTKAGNEVVDLAKTATATASSVEGAEYTADKAIDGDKNTRWSSAFNDFESIVLDLGCVCNIGSVMIDWEAAYAEKYSLYWSMDGKTWNLNNGSEVSSYMPNTISMFYNKPARYIKVQCIKRGTPYGVSIFEISVMGTKAEEAATETTTETTTEAATEATTEAATEAPTTQEQTTKAPGPLEVMGLVVTEPEDNKLGIVWGQDAERINSGCTYNVFIDGILRFVNVPCNYYEFDGVPAGDHTVMVQAVLNHQGSKGKTIVYNVKGQKLKTDLAVGATVTGPSMEGCEASNLCDGNDGNIWMVRQLYPSLSIDLGRVCDVTAFEIKWAGISDAPKGFSISTSVDGETWENFQNVNVPDLTYTNDWSYVNLTGQARYIHVSMGGYNNLAHFYAARKISVY